jgi:CRISPR-associated protein Cas1
MEYKFEYRGKIVIEVKARELSHHLLGKRKTVDLVKLFCMEKRDDSDMISVEMGAECC